MIDGTNEPRMAHPHASPEDVSKWLPLVSPDVHAVQFYEDERFLVDTVGRFLVAGLDAGESVVVIASERRRSSLIRYLMQHGSYPSGDSDRVNFLSVHDALSRFMRGGMPDAAAFRTFADSLLDAVRSGGRTPRVRTYGEMADVLWRNGNTRAALRLEDLWNEAAAVHQVARLCAHATANFDQAGDIERFLEVCEKHSHVLPTEDFFERVRPAEAVGLLVARAMEEVHATKPR